MKSQWEANFNELVAYKKKHGNFKIPHSTNGLGGWISQQRKGRKKGQLSEDRIRRLDEIGFDWDPFESLWEASFCEMVAYKVEHGAIKVPQPPTGLGVWVRNIRSSRKNGQLSEDKIRRLDEIGFDWEPFESLWEASFSALVEYKAEHGDTNVPQVRKGLGDWVILQRQNRRLGQLSEEKNRRLDELGFEWDPLGSQWETRFSELGAYKAEYSDINVPQKWPSGLGRWIDTQRQRRKKGRLSEDKIQRLDEIGFDWGKTGDILQQS